MASTEELKARRRDKENQRRLDEEREMNERGRQLTKAFH